MKLIYCMSAIIVQKKPNKNLFLWEKGIGFKIIKKNFFFFTEILGSSLQSRLLLSPNNYSGVYNTMAFFPCQY